jgi:L-histidine N-alpha-methyltransferase
MNHDRHIAQEIAQGLLSEQPFISPKFFYDRLGSHLFSAITAVPEYYIPTVEASIMARVTPEIAQLAGQGRVLIDIGAGDGRKAAELFVPLAPAAYVAIDISAEHLDQSVRALQREFPDLPMLSYACDFSRQFSLPDSLPSGSRMAFYPGSSLGNFSPDQALAFLSQVRSTLAGGGLLIGVDLVKDEAVLNAAYNDLLGVTAAFNKNILLNVNRLLGANFSITEFEHVAFFNAAESRIEMHLQALHNVTVTWPGGTLVLKAGDRIHTENSYKYTTLSLKTLLEKSGFSKTRIWTDPRDYFAVAWAL